jgi:hypothetical protein
MGLPTIKGGSRQAEKALFGGANRAIVKGSLRTKLEYGEAPAKQPDRGFDINRLQP